MRTYEHRIVNGQWEVVNTATGRLVSVPPQPVLPRGRRHSEKEWCRSHARYLNLTVDHARYTHPLGYRMEGKLKPTVTQA
jgi:hypothetical protein